MPPAFALSQDQTLRFISTQYPTSPAGHQASTNRPITGPAPTQKTLRPPRQKLIRNICLTHHSRYANKHPIQPAMNPYLNHEPSQPKHHTLITHDHKAPPTYPFHPDPIVKEQPVAGTDRRTAAAAVSASGYLGAGPPHVNAMTSPDPGRKKPGFPPFSCSTPGHGPDAAGIPAVRRAIRSLHSLRACHDLRAAPARAGRRCRPALRGHAASAIRPSMTRPCDPAETWTVSPSFTAPSRISPASGF
jgi:hypothetical protein